MQTTRSKGPSGITRIVAEDLFFFFFFCFSLFETTEICFGSTKMEISTGKKKNITQREKSPLKGPPHKLHADRALSLNSSTSTYDFIALTGQHIMV